MKPVYAIMQTAASLTLVYMLLCVIRIFLSWLPQTRHNKASSVLYKITEPYLSGWRRIGILRRGTIDFSPIVGIAILALVYNILIITIGGGLTFGRAAALIVGLVWSPFAFVLTFFIILIGLRLTAYFARWNSLHPAWRIIDTLINPVLYRIKRFVYKNRLVHYTQGLITGLLVLLAARIVLGLLFAYITRLLSRM